MKIIQALPVEHFESEFLRAEWYKPFYNGVRETYQDIVMNGDLTNDEQNRIRRWLLWEWRKPLLERLPSDIQWHLAEVEANDFGELLIIREIGWEKTFGNRKRLRDIAQAIQEGVEDQGIDFALIDAIKQNIGKQPFNEKLILIANTSNPPYTIVEGNHRAVAFQLKHLDTGDNIHIPKEVLIGISQNMQISPWLNYEHITIS